MQQHSDTRPAATLAQALAAARLHHAMLPAAEWGHALHDPAQAYAVQDEIGAALGWFDGPPRHWKSGGPSRDVTLTHAPLPPAGVRDSPADFTDWPLHTRGIEAEIALRLRADVTPDMANALDQSGGYALIDAMTVSIEVVDSRWREGGAAPALLRLADQQSHGALALGRWVPYRRLDWAAQRCEARIGKQPPTVRTGTYALEDPAWLLPTWLRHATRHGDSVPAGTVVTTGTWVGLLAAAPGDKVEVNFDGIGSAALQL